jgi:hypothetical protein
MGAIRQIETANNNTGLEITYGGKESPFGGVDTSAPPAYIDPRCFAAADGHLVIDNKLVAVSLKPLTIPPLWNSVVGVLLLKFGTFYNSLTGQLNYALGYTATAVTGPPSGVKYIFYITSWNPSDPTEYNTDVLPITLFDAEVQLQQASITLDCIATNVASNGSAQGAVASITSVSSPLGSITGLNVSGGTGYTVGQYLVVLQQGAGSSPIQPAIIQVATIGGGGSIATFTITAAGENYIVGNAYLQLVDQGSISLIINGPAGGPNTYTVNAISSSGYSRQAAVTTLVALINAGPDPNVSAAPSIDGYSIILSALVGGATGNSITVQDASVNSDGTLPPPFYFSCRVARNLEGGDITEPASAPRSFVPPASTAEVGGTLYIANIGPMILKYSGPGEFTTSTMYNGVGVLRKFAGSLIGLRLQGQLGTFTQNEDMIFAWTSGDDLDEWSPVTGAGDVTGAGFEEVADIGDYLSGLIVTNATAFIIRAKGVSYATATGNASLPYDINHLGLGDEGEGAQISNLVCQYDQVGVFVGNTDIFQVSNTLTSIGQKIKAFLFSILLGVPPSVNEVFESANACAVNLGGDVFPLVVIAVGGPNGPSNTSYLFLYNTNNGTWTTLTFTVGPSRTTTVLASLTGTISTENTLAAENLYNLTQQAVMVQTSLSGVIQAPVLYVLTEGNRTVDGVGLNNTITFLEEEILFGRDVTVDSLYVALVADVTETTYIDFYLNGVLYATLGLLSGTYNTLSGNPIESQLFPLPAYGAGADTGHTPQLSYVISPTSDGQSAQIRFTKIMMLGSIASNQRPT